MGSGPSLPAATGCWRYSLSSWPEKSKLPEEGLRIRPEGPFLLGKCLCNLPTLCRLLRPGRVLTKEPGPPSEELPSSCERQLPDRRALRQPFARCGFHRLWSSALGHTESAVDGRDWQFSVWEATTGITPAARLLRLGVVGSE